MRQLGTRPLGELPEYSQDIQVGFTERERVRSSHQGVRGRSHGRAAFSPDTEVARVRRRTFHGRGRSSDRVGGAPAYFLRAAIRHSFNPDQTRACGPTAGRRGREETACGEKQKMNLLGEGDGTRFELGCNVVRGVYADVEAYYSARVARYGATPLGVDWSCQATQMLRF